MHDRDPRKERELRRDRLYRSSDNGMIAGVCAGAAEFFGFDVTLTRVLVVVGSFIFPSLVLIYVILAILLKRKPTGHRRHSEHEERLQQKVRSEPHATLSTVRYRFRELDRRLQRMEKYVTSKRFRLDREFEGLKD
jgi:phage shock protein C